MWTPWVRVVDGGEGVTLIVTKLWGLNPLGAQVSILNIENLVQTRVIV